MKKSLAHSARQAMEAVVQILAKGYDELSNPTILNPLYAIPIDWYGSGFFIKVKGQEGYILTNAHVVRNAYHLQIKTFLTSEETFDVHVVGFVEGLDPDVALLRLKDTELKRLKTFLGKKNVPYLHLGDSDRVLRGTEIKAIGHPMGMDEPNITGGEITNFISGNDQSTERLVTDAPINLGNSGGPSVNSQGEVIGINTSVLTRAQNISFITPINFAQIIIKNIVNKRSLRLTEIGAIFQTNSFANSRYLGQKKPKGIIVSEISPKGMFDRAKIKKWDILLKVQKYTFDRHGNVLTPLSHRRRNVFDIFRLIPLGQDVTMKIFRKGQTLNITTKTMAPSLQGICSHPLIYRRKFIEFGGMVIQPLSTEILTTFASEEFSQTALYIGKSELKTNKIVITSVSEGSQAEELGLLPGLVIKKIGKENVHTLDKFKKIINFHFKKGDKFVLIEMQDGQFGIFYFPKNFDGISILSLHPALLKR